MSKGPLTGAACRAELGAPARVSLTRKVRTCYRVEWEYDGHRVDFGSPFASEEYEVDVVPERRVRVRHFYSKHAAYRWMALRLIFARRDKLATGMSAKGHPEGCRLCDAMPSHPEDGPGFCRYHGGDGFEELRDRMARWLRWRDSRREP